MENPCFLFSLNFAGTFMGKYAPESARACKSRGEKDHKKCVCVECLMTERLDQTKVGIGRLCSVYSGVSSVS